MIKRLLASVLVASLGLPLPVLAQQAPPAGVVTVLEGSVTARRQPQPVALKFKDDVFLQDTVVTEDKSLARMLLGGKAVVTVRERSAMTITKVPPADIITADAGKFGLAVARERMTPGERIEIRTPNAICGVRGTVVVTEIIPPPRPGGAVTTNFYVLRGSIEVRQGNPPGPPVTVNANEQASVSGNAPPRTAPIRADQMGAILAGLQPSGMRGVEVFGQDSIKAQALQNAVQLVSFISGRVIAGQEEPRLATAPPVPSGNSAAPLTPLSNLPDIAAELTQVPTPPPPCAGCVRVQGPLSVSGSTFFSFKGNFVSDSPLELLGFESASVTQNGGFPFIDALNGAHVTLAGPLAALIDSSIVTDGTFLTITDSSLTTIDTSSALISLDPSTITTSGALVALSNSSLSLSGQLLTDVSGTLSLGHELLRMTSGSSLTATSTAPLVGFNGTTLNGASLLAMDASTVTLNGALLLASASTIGLGADAVSLGGGSVMTNASLDDMLRVLGGSHLNIGRDVLNVGGASTVNVASGLAELLGAQVTIGRDVIHLEDRSTVTLTEGFSASGSNMQINRDLVRAESGSAVIIDGALMSLGTGNTINVGGALARAVSGGLVLTTGPTFEAFGAGNTLKLGNANQTGSIFGVPVSETNGGFVSIGPNPGLSGNGFVAFGADGFGSLVTIDPIVLPNGPFITYNVSSALAGGILTLVDGATPTSEPVAPISNTFGNLVLVVKDPVTGGKGQGVAQLAGPLIQVTGATLSGSSGILVQVQNTTLALGGSLLSMSSAEIDNTAGFGDLINIDGRGMIRTFGTEPLIRLNASNLLMAGQIVSLTGNTIADAVLALSGPLLVSNGGFLSFNTTAGSPFAHIGILVSQGTVVGLGSQPLIQLTDTTVEGGTFIQVGCGDSCGLGQMFLAGPLLEATNSPLNLSRSLLTLGEEEGHLVSTSSGSLLKLNGQGHILGSGGNPVIDIIGQPLLAAETDPDALPGMVVSTDQPLIHPGTIFEANSASITSGNGSSPAPFLNVDSALLSATAPLLKLTSTNLTHNGDLLGLSNNAKVNANLQGDALFKFNASNVTLTTGSLAALNDGSFLRVIGNLLSLANSSNVSIANGALVNVSNGSLFKLTGGSLIVKDAGSSITVNGFAPTTTVAGIPVAVVPGGQITVAPGFVPFVGGAPGGTGAVLVIDGTSKVVLGP